MPFTPGQAGTKRRFAYSPALMDTAPSMDMEDVTMQQPSIKRRRFGAPDSSPQTIHNAAGTTATTPASVLFSGGLPSRSPFASITGKYDADDDRWMYLQYRQPQQPKEGHTRRPTIMTTNSSMPSEAFQHAPRDGRRNGRRAGIMHAGGIVVVVENRGFWALGCSHRDATNKTLAEFSRVSVFFVIIS